MTVSQAVVEWLNGYDGGVELADSVGIDHLEAEKESRGVFKAPGGRIEEFINGSRDVTANYIFCVRQPAQTNDLRKDANEWLEGLEKWVCARDMQRQLPDLQESGREIYQVRVTNTYAPEDQTDAEITYQLGLAVLYFEKGDMA